MKLDNLTIDGAVDIKMIRTTMIARNMLMMLLLMLLLLLLLWVLKLLLSDNDISVSSHCVCVCTIDDMGLSYNVSLRV